MDTNDAGSRGRFEKVGNFFKVADGVAYGWAIICTEGGKAYWDLQDDHIPEDEMVAAAIDFMKSARVGSDQHTGEHVGDIVFGYPVTKASPSLGVVSDKTGLLIGYMPQDPVHLDMIAAGERTGFSIGGFLLEYEDGEIGKGVWSTAYVNELPDDSFLYVKAGKKVGEKVRMFPVKDKTGKIDLPHLRNALSRVKQSTLPADVQDAVTKKGEAMLPKAKLGKGTPDPGDVYVPGDMGSKKKPKGKVYRRFKIDEISLVTKPAQEGATVAYVKGATVMKAKDTERVFTSSEDGHQHVICLDELTPNSEWTLTTGCAITGATGGHLGEWHSHQIIVDDAGAITIADNAGHGHSVDAEIDLAEYSAPAVVDNAPASVVAPATIRMSAPAARKPENLTAEQPPSSVTTMTDAEIAALQKSHDRAVKMSDLTDAQRAYAKSLAPGEVDSFISKSASERDALAKGSIEYTAEDGTVYYKGDDARLIKQAKKNDELSKSLVLESSLRKDAEFAKAAAEDMGHYPEDEKVHAAVLRAIEGIADEPTRKAARTMIKAGDAAIAKASRMGGTKGALAKGDTQLASDPVAKAADAVKVAVEAYQKAHNLPSYEAAFADATASDPATRAAYDQLMEARRGRGAGLDDN